MFHLFKQKNPISGASKADGVLRGGLQREQQLRGDLHPQEGVPPQVPPGPGGGDETEVCSQVGGGGGASDRGLSLNFFI